MFNKLLDSEGNLIFSGEAAVCVRVCALSVRLFRAYPSALRHSSQCVNQMLCGDWSARVPPHSSASDSTRLPFLGVVSNRRSRGHMTVLASVARRLGSSTHT